MKMLFQFKLIKKDFLFLSNNGNFLLLPINKKSRFFGWFVPYKNYYIKILDSLKNKKLSNEKIEEIKLLSNNCAKIVYDGFYEKYILGKNYIFYKTNKASWIELYFDIKHIYDTEEWNRIYNVSLVDNKLKISYQKDDIFFEVFIESFTDIKILNEWIEVFYDYDKYRNSPPFNRWLFKPAELFANKLIIYFDKKPRKITKKKIRSLYDLIKQRILDFSHNWISAGFPWYYQEWTRDVLISLRGFYLIGEKKLVKRKLIEYTNYINSCGKLYTTLQGVNGCSDGLGWYIKRFFDFINLFNSEERKKILEIISNALDNYYECFFDEKKNVFFSNPNETWMDTLNRVYPLEIQFLMLNAYKKIYEYTKKENYLEIFEKLSKGVRNFVEEVSLIDDLNNRSIRPNIFLSYYIFPDYFKKEEWEKFFDYALFHLWLDWGGLSSISKYDKRFIEEHNGDNFFSDKNKSMHSGDSWYYINHIAALSMYKLNKEKYSNYIRKIISASLNTIKEIGTLPELSSAKERRSEGAISQLWSLCTLVELLHDTKDTFAIYVVTYKDK